jgi:3'-phosphoadenosine 5'-phosphosulfate sulfotransferase (PAPS reductase)/FAD synthetase
MHKDKPRSLNLQEKIKETETFLEELFRTFQNPVFMNSFGKDSMVLLYLLKSMKRIPPVIFYEDSWFPRKYEFAHRIIASMNLEVYDYPPVRTSMLYGKGIPAFVNEYLLSGNMTMALPKNIQEYEDGDTEWLCGLNFFTRPLGTIAFPWDLVLIGHKSCDEDQIYGRVPLKTRLVTRGSGPAYAFPLKDWTHDDVWDYTEENDVPVQQSRYDQAHRTEWKSKYFSSDYFHACIRCVDKRRAGTEVSCPKLGHSLVNISDKVAEFNWKPDYFKEDLYATATDNNSRS